MGNIFLLYILSPKFEKFFTWVIIVYCCIDGTICTEWQKSENGLIMKTVIEHMRSLCPISDETVEELMKCVTLCHFPKRYQLIQENRFCKYAYFIEKGMTRSFWLVDGEEITTSFSCEGGIVFSMDELSVDRFDPLV